MTDDVEIWYYARCSKSRRAKETLEDGGVNASLREYREDEPTVEEVRELVDRVDDPERLVRDKDAPAGAFDEATREDPQALAEALAEHPQALQRPVVVRGPEAWIARDEATLEAVLDRIG